MIYTLRNSCVESSGGLGRDIGYQGKQISFSELRWSEKVIVTDAAEVQVTLPTAVASQAGLLLASYLANVDSDDDGLDGNVTIGFLTGTPVFKLRENMSASLALNNIGASLFLASDTDSTNGVVLELTFIPE